MGEGEKKGSWMQGSHQALLENAIARPRENGTAGSGEDC